MKKTYQCKCPVCGHEFEVTVSTKDGSKIDHVKVTCTECGEKFDLQLNESQAAGY